MKSEEYIDYLSKLIPEKDSLKLVRQEADKFYREHEIEACYNMAFELYDSSNFQIQEVGVFLFGYVANQFPKALLFLRDTVSEHESWKVQEILGMSFDRYCKMIDYQNALPTIQEWLSDDRANVRRAASEGLRIWTSRSYFNEHPEIAIALLGEHKDDASEYVRKSIGNALRDISKKFPEQVKAELATWDTSKKTVAQVYELAGKFVDA